MTLGFQQLRLDNGYEMETTFWNDFTIADAFGLKAIKDTFNRAFREWKNDRVYMTELVVVLNHKIWHHYYSGREDYAKLYDELWRKADNYALDHFKGKDMDFFYKVTRC